MKNQKIVLMIAIGTLFLLSHELRAQHDQSEKREGVYMDSLETAEEEQIQAKKDEDANTIADYQYDQKETKAKAKEARRVENEANAAARESRYALRAEKRAQKARKNADRQAEKASRARVKSDRN